MGTTDGEEKEKMNQQRGQWRQVVSLLAVMLLVVVAISIAGNQGSLLPAKANSAYLSITDLQPGSKMTDAISVALDTAKASGLTIDPDDMQITKGVYRDLLPPGTLDSIYNDRSVLLVQIKAKFLFDGYGVSAMPVNYLYIYIDEKTGMPFERLAGLEPIQQFDQKTWVKVSKNDTAQFPIPDFASSESATGESLGPTPTLVPVP
jgi:hypothetical protein